MSTSSATPIVSNRPKDDAFHQQRLKTWQPILSPMNVIIIFLAIGVIFIPTGIALNSASNGIYEDTVTYDGPEIKLTAPGPNTCLTGDQCNIQFKISEDVEGPLYVYYGLENFYQNHRLYVKSQNVNQLLGNPITDITAIETDCKPAVYSNGVKGAPYVDTPTPGYKLLYPCGLIANSMFNDKIKVAPPHTMDEKGIAWESDFKKFKNPQGSKSVQVTSGVVADAATCIANNLPSDCRLYDAGTVPYLYWYPNMDTYRYNFDNDLYKNIITPVEGMQNEHFMVWMRTAALPKFRKLYGKIAGPLKKGEVLTFQVDSKFEVRSFGGSKSIIISTISSIGGKNNYVGTSFIVVGSLAFLLTALFVVKHVTSERRRLGDTNLLRWEE